MSSNEQPPSPAAGTGKRKHFSRWFPVALALTGVVALSLVPTSAWQTFLEWRAVRDIGRPAPVALSRQPPVDVDSPVGPIRVGRGDQLPDVAIESWEGGKVRLARFAGRVPLVIEFGSFT
jgi:hypothetical protein